jgi:hypothetical protein
MGHKFESADEILQGIARIVHSIQRGELDSVFKEWERRLKRCITVDGDYGE